MSLQNVKEQVLQLSTSDRLALVNLIIDSLQQDFIQKSESTELVSIPGSSIRGHLQAQRMAIVNQMCGLLKTDRPAPSDAEVEAMLEERRIEKYSQ